LFFLLISPFSLLSQNNGDSLVLFSDLKFHSEFERATIFNYVEHRQDTLNLFLSIDPSMNSETALSYSKIFQNMLNELYDKKIESKKINKKVKETFTKVHNEYLQKYNEVEYLPALFQRGTYNCVSSSIIYAMLFSSLQIPFKVKVTSSHVYLVANPGPKSILVETTNPKLQKEEYLQDFKKKYVSYLKSLKVITEQEYKSKSLDEIFEEKVKNVKPANFDNLIGFQYYNKGLDKYSEDQIEDAYHLLQKAYFFYPSDQVKSVLYPVLLRLLERCKYSKASDIDYVAQLARYEDVGAKTINDIFKEIVTYYLQFTDKQTHCDSMYERLVAQLPDQEMKQEVSFNYNLLMSEHYKNKDEQQKYIESALKVKQNHREANELFKEFIERKLSKKTDYKQLLEEIEKLRQKYNYDFIDTLLTEYELMAHLNMAYDFFKYNYIDEGEVYLKIFEKESKFPVESENKKFIHTIESTYRILAVYYFYRNNKTKAIQTIDRGLKYVPQSRYLQTAVY